MQCRISRTWNKHLRQIWWCESTISDGRTPILKSIRCWSAASVGRFEVLGRHCLVWTRRRLDVQQRSGLNANAVRHITAVLPSASCSSPGDMIRTHAEEFAERPVVMIVARRAVASAKSSTIDVCLRCTV